MTTQGGSYSWNATCDVCGFQYKANELRKRWDGLMVCEADFETRHPLDFYRVKNDHHQLPYTRRDDVANTGFLPTIWPTTVPTGYVGENVTGQKFTVGAEDRRLLGVVFGGVNTYNGSYWQYITELDLPKTVKLWDSGGNLLTSWVIKTLDFNFKTSDEYKEATAPLLPSYILEANTTYTISIYMSGGGLPSQSLITSVQPYMTYVGSYEVLSDNYPSDVLIGTSATPYFDILTGSTN